MIPPDPATVSLDPGNSGPFAARMQSIEIGESAEAKVHRFLGQSKQHAFILQNFTTSRCRRTLKTLTGTSSYFDDEINEIANIEIDFLILHAFLGVVAIECKGVKEFQQRRYTGSKKQLDKVDILLNTILKMLSSTGKQSYSALKVVSFPFVTMKQGVKDPCNLGENDLELRPELWWDNLLKENGTENNKFQKDPAYQDVVTLLLGIYSSAAIQKTERERSFYKSCVPSMAPSPPDLPDRLELHEESPVGSPQELSSPGESPERQDLSKQQEPTERQEVAEQQTSSRSGPFSSSKDNSSNTVCHMRDTKIFHPPELIKIMYEVEIAVKLRNLFFLNPGQLQVMNCTTNKQLILGEAGTGKTAVLMEKAFDLLMEGKKVAFLIPRKLHLVHKHFSKSMLLHNMGCPIFYYHETIDQNTLKQLEQLEHFTVLIDDLQNISRARGYTLDQRELDVRDFLRKVPKAVVTSIPFNSSELPIQIYQQHLLNSSFHLLKLREQCVQK